MLGARHSSGAIFFSVNKRRATGVARPQQLTLPPRQCRQHLVEGDRILAHARAAGVVDGVGDGSTSAADAELAQPLGAQHVGVLVKLVEQDGLDLRHVGMDRHVIVHQVLGDEGAQGLSATGSVKPSDEYKKYSQYAYGAHFAEVGVDQTTGEVRLRRMLGVFAAGRILNPKTAHSQLIGGMIWGVGSALEEEAVVDPRMGAFVTQDLVHYHVPVHADVPQVEAVLLDEFDKHANVLGSKGVGELGICGAGAAVANAVYNACGARVREYPITLDKVLPALTRRQG